MALSNNIAIFKQLGKSAFLTGLDALRPASALPLDDAAIADADFLNQLFIDYGVDGYQALGNISAASLTDIQSISSNCNNRVIALQYDEVNTATASSLERPPTMFLKMPVKSLTTRVFFNVIMSWELECQFYRKLAKHLPVRTPKAYAMANKGSRFVMLMEDLHADPSVVLHTNLEMMQGPSLDKVRRCLTTLATIHGSFHGIGKEEREDYLPNCLQPFTAPVMRAISPMMGSAALKNVLKNPQITLTDAQIFVYQKAVKHWDRLVDHWSQEPLTLVHGDSHLGNHFLHGHEAGMLDWQAAQWGKGIRDVQYFLTDSLPAEVLAGHEQELVHFYHDLLTEKGVEIDFDEIWHQYRGFSFQTWMTIIVSIGFGAMTDDMDELMPEIHRRCIASIERLDLAGWLDEVLEIR